MLVDNAHGAATATFFVMEQNERPGGDMSHDHVTDWKHSSFNNIEVSSFGSLDDIRSFTASPPLSSPTSHLNDTTAIAAAEDSLDDDSVGPHHHEILFPTAMINNSVSTSLVRPLVNAVHMEIQENAKLPTFNLSVDRSNSSEVDKVHYNTSALSPQTRKEIDDLIRLEEYDKSLSEFFLKSDQRNSLTLTYEAAGALLDELLSDPVLESASAMTSRSNSHRNVATEFQQQQQDADDNEKKVSATASAATMSTTTTASDFINQVVVEDLVNMMVEPTPLEQIKARGAQWKEFHVQHRNYPLPRNDPLPIPTGTATTYNHSTPQLENSHHDHNVPSVVTASAPAASLTTSPLSGALATAAAIAAAAAASTPASAPAGSKSSDSKKSVLYSSSLHSSFHRFPEAAAVHPTGLLGLSSPYHQTENNKEQQQSPPPRKLFPATTTETADAAQENLSAVPYLPSLQPQQQNLNRRASLPLSPRVTPLVKNVTTTQAMATAAKLKSQFGFGDNHVVPSVPDPPPKPGVVAKSHSTASSAATVAVVEPPRPVAQRVSAQALVAKKAPKVSSDNGTRDSGSPSSPSNIHSGEAYERKKQRAKDARVRLNDSIERLSIAISMGGSQSKQRAAQLRDVQSSVLSKSKISSLIRIMEDASATADMAKKWDRPSFVGVAASLIQALNAECEALMEVVLDGSNRTVAHQTNHQSCNRSPASPRCSTPTNCASPGSGSNHEVKRSKSMAALSPERSGTQELQPKRQRVDNSSPGNSLAAKSLSLFSDASVVERLAAFLDPVSLLRCQLVSSSWKSNAVFSSDTTWNALAMKRFRRVQVRHWMEQLKFSSGTTTSSLELYRKMDEANVMPYFNSEGMVRLGDGRIGTRVSAWAFLVKRSNGETTRSVKREPKAKDDKGIAASSSIQCEYVALPVIELRIVVQNTGMGNSPIVIKNQVVTVDASTRRRGEEYRSITWDDRLGMTMRKLEDDECGEERKVSSRLMDPLWEDQLKATIIASGQQPLGNELCRLGLYDAHVMTVFLHTQGCSTMSRFQERSNFTKLLVCLNGTTVPLVIPFLREDA